MEFTKKSIKMVFRFSMWSIILIVLWLALSVTAAVVKPGKPQAGDNYHPVIHELDGTEININPNTDTGVSSP